MKFHALFALLILQFAANSQLVSSSVINTTGSSYSQGPYHFDWSVGEMAIVEPMISGNGMIILTNGFLQPAFHGTIPVFVFSDDEVKILPNPTYAQIELKLSTIHQGTLLMSVYDTRGRLVYSGKKIARGVPDNEKIDLSGVGAGTYFFKVQLEPKKGSLPKSGSYKIVKL